MNASEKIVRELRNRHPDLGLVTRTAEHLCFWKAKKLDRDFLSKLTRLPVIAVGCNFAQLSSLRFIYGLPEDPETKRVSLSVIGQTDIGSGDVIETLTVVPLNGYYIDLPWTPALVVRPSPGIEVRNATRTVDEMLDVGRPDVHTARQVRFVVRIVKGASTLPSLLSVISLGVCDTKTCHPNAQVVMLPLTP